jgi:hypothetical protein
MSYIYQMSQVNDGAPAETPGPTGSGVLPAAQRNVQAVFRRLHVNLGGPAALGVLIAAIVIVAGVMLMLLGPGNAHSVTSLVHTHLGIPG